MAEGKDPEQAVEAGRRNGDIPKINDLPAPWGPKQFVPPPKDELLEAGYLPPKYPSESSPLVDM